MQKILLIIGSPDSGKLHRVFQIADEYQRNEVVSIHAKDLNKRNYFPFGPCDENTKLLVVHYLESTDRLFEFYPLVNGFQVNEKHKAPYIIHPRIIITSSTITQDQLPQDASFTSRFDILDMDHSKHF